MDFEDIKDGFAPFDRLIQIDIFGEKHFVPENNSLLRGFQYLAIDNISYGEFCWNGDCLNCQVWVKNGDKEKAIIACRTNVTEEMEIIRLSDEIELEGD